MSDFRNFLLHAGLNKGCNTIMHSSYKKIRNAFGPVSIEEIIESLEDIITPCGSLIMPAFTYCFKKEEGGEIFNPLYSRSKVGAISEKFRNTPGVIRTSSPTHSFSLWGKAAKEISHLNSPISPLGKGSVLDWIADQQNSYILMPGTDFSSLSFCHYLEVMAEVPWYNYSPWEYMGVLPFGISQNGEQELIEIPGCSNSFVSFERFLLDKGKIEKIICNDLESYVINVRTLLEEGIPYFKKYPQTLLCPEGSCRACDSRRHLIKQHL